MQRPVVERLAVQQVVVLGSTGSIGVSTLDVIARHPDRFAVFALAARSSGERLFEQIQQFQPRYAVLVDTNAAASVQARVRQAGLKTEVLAGEQALAEISSAADVDTVMAAIVGAAGLLPTLAAARAGKRILLANKEALVMSGPLFMQAVREHGAMLLPIDSEHNAIFQCLPAPGHDTDLRGERDLRANGVEKILLTASGGPFLRRELRELAGVTPDQACAHPTWNMGRKISVDSATLMNKGLEVIEACYLFNATRAQVDVLVHPQSIVHSLVRYVDGSVLAQLGNPDMRTPIAHAMAWPDRIAAGVAPLDLTQIAKLEFLPVDTQRFPCLDLAYQALQAGGSAPAVLNAANEIAVEAFLSGRIAYTRIASVITETLQHCPAPPVETLESLLAIDAEARRIATGQVGVQAA